jgi:hypothetical protein
MQKIYGVPYIPASTTTVQTLFSDRAGAPGRKRLKVDAISRSYRLTESSCYLLLALSVTRVIQYSVSVFLR